MARKKEKKTNLTSTYSSVPIQIPTIYLANTFTVKEPCFMRVLAELTNCNANEKHACK